MNNDLIEKGKRIIEQLGGERADVLKKWMAHYVAELMEKANSTDEAESQAAADKCASVILKLWDLMIQEQVQELKNRSWNWLNQADEEKEERYEKLRKALANPESVKDAAEPVDVDDGLTLQSLNEVEDWLLELLIKSEVLNEPDTDILDETAIIFAQSEIGTQDVTERVAKVFPDLADLCLTDKDETSAKITEALRSIYLLRHAILWSDEMS
jgi:hypothetical protein